MGYTTDADGGEKNWLQRLADKVPGFSGYQAKERRREIDKLHRDWLADRVRATKPPVAAVVQELSETGRLFEVTPLERISKKIDTIESRVRHATYGYSGFFDAAQIKEDQLDRIYQFDLGLVEKVEAVEMAAAALAAAKDSAAELKTGAATLEQAVDGLTAAFDSRHQAINGFGTEAPGRPLFS
jgi:hypothetical protein